MITLIERLIAIREFAKEIHYNAHGESFYGIHLLMDRVADGIYDAIDTIKEVCYLGEITQPPKASEILKVAAAYIPELADDNKDNIASLENLIAQALDDVKSLKGDSPAKDAILDSIAQDLQLKRGLLWRSK